MDNAHPSRNGTIQLIVAVILTKTVILYCSYLYPYMQEFCAGSLVHGMMSSFYTVWREICGIQCTYSGTFTNYFGLYFLACRTGIIVLHFSGEKARAKWARSAKNAQKGRTLLPPCLPPFVYGGLRTLHSCQCLSGKH